MKKIKYFLTLKKISDNTLEEIEVNPFSNIVISGEKYDLPRRDYMKKVTGNLTFQGDEFNRIVAHFTALNCQSILFRIAEFCNDDYQTIFEGYINNRVGEYDYDSCLVNLKIEDIDKYKCLEQNWENLIPFHVMSAQAKSVDILPYVKRYKAVWDYKSDRTPINVINLYELQNSSQTWSAINSDTANNVGSNSSPTAIYNTLAAFTGSVLTPYYLDTSNSAVMRYRQTIAETIPIFTQNIKTYIIYDFGSGVYMVAKNTYQLYHTNIGTTGFDKGFAFEGLGSDRKVVSNGRKLEEVLEDLLSRYCGGMTLKSDFFQWNPTNVSSINYVTAAVNRLTNLIIFQKSDVKRPNAVNRAFGKSTELSIKFLLENICKMFNCHYYLTSSNVLVIEHMSWSGWYNLLGYSTTRNITNSYGIRGMIKSIFKDVNIPIGEHFEFMDAYNPDFIGTDITYPLDCVTNDTTINTTIERITTDVMYLAFGNKSMYAYEELGSNPSNKDIEEQKDRQISDDGFVIMATSSAANNPIHVTNGILQGNTIAANAAPNNFLSWAKLHTDYFKQGRYYSSGNMNNSFLSGGFTFLVHNSEQAGITISGCCGNFTPFQYYITELSNSAEVSTYQYDIESGNVTFNLTYYK